MQTENVYFSTENYNKLTDEEIVLKIKNGDEQALSYLLDKYKNKVEHIGAKPGFDVTEPLLF